MRNRTVRSVLARRPMFANGGMLPPVTQSPMASGILGSSAPLIETVNNQQSPDRGVRVSMANGGVARMANGGTSPQYTAQGQRMAPWSGSRTGPAADAARFTYSPEHTPSSPYLGSTSAPPLRSRKIKEVAKALESIIPGLDTTRLSGEEITALAVQYGVIGDTPEGSEVDASQTGTFMPPLRKPPAREVDTSTPFVPVEGPPPPSKFAGIGSIFDLGGDRKTAIRPRVSERVSEIVQETKAPPEEVGTFMPTLRKGPPKPPDISQLLGTPEGSEIDASQVPDAVSALDEYYRTGINPADMTMEEVKAYHAGKAGPWGPGLTDDPEGMVGFKALLGRQIKIDEQKIADAQAQDAAAVTEGVQAAEYDPPPDDPGFSTGPLSSLPGVIEGDIKEARELAEEEAAQAAKEPEVGDGFGEEGTQYKEDEEVTIEAGAGPAGGADAVETGPVVVDAVTAPPEADGKAETEPSTAAQVVVNAFENKNPPGAPAKTKEQYIQEFKEGLPKYEGMSEEEKGFTIMEAGFRVMAGQSSNAIENIGKGLKGISKEFVADKKARRAYDQQVDMSAAKYGLGAIAKQRALLDADNRQLYMFYDQSKKTDANPYGETTYISRAEIMANKGKLPSKYKSEKFVLGQIKGINELKAKLAKLNDDARKEKTIDYKEADKIDGSLKEAREAFVSGEVGVNLLQGVIKKLAVDSSDIVGGAAEATSLWGKAMNLLNRPTSQSYKNRAEAERDIKRAFQKLIPITLGSAQTANSISNRDVQFLADAYIDNGFLNPDGKGGFSISLATANPEALVRQLQGAVKEFRTAQDGALTTFDQKLYRIGQATPGPYGPKYFEPAIRKIAPAAESYRERVSKRGGKVPSTLRVFDYFDRKTGKLLKPIPRRK